MAQDDLRSVGILGGTFNPPHLGHLALARRAGEELGLQRVVLMPAHTSPFKPAAKDPGPEHRLRMCELLAGESRELSACALEVERGGASYTVDTLTAIHASHPDAALTFIVGADTASTLPAWREPERLLELADLAVAARAGSGQAQVLRSLASLKSASRGGAPGGRPRAGDPQTLPGVRFLNMPVIDISSSEVRARAAHGEPIDDLVGREVARYVAQHGLYRGAE